jgi:hypothetical protein
LSVACHRWSADWARAADPAIRVATAAHGTAAKIDFTASPPRVQVKYSFFLEIIVPKRFDSVQRQLRNIPAFELGYNSRHQGRACVKLASWLTAQCDGVARRFSPFHLALSSGLGKTKLVASGHCCIERNVVALHAMAVMVRY